MARKKQARGTEPVTVASGHGETPPHPLELAVAVSEVVRILSVALRRSSIESEPEIFGRREDHRVRIEIDETSHRIEAEANLLAVTVSFALLAIRSDDGGSPPGLVIRASFALEYGIPAGAAFEDAQLEAFAMTNAVYNAWPYWREYVQSTTTRMGLPPIIVPVFRL